MVYCAAAVMAGVSWAFQTLQAAFHPALRRRAVPVVVTPFAIPVAGLDLTSRLYSTSHRQVRIATPATPML